MRGLGPTAWHTDLHHGTHTIVGKLAPPVRSRLLEKYKKTCDLEFPLTMIKISGSRP